MHTKGNPFSLREQRIRRRKICLLSTALTSSAIAALGYIRTHAYHTWLCFIIAAASTAYRPSYLINVDIIITSLDRYGMRAKKRINKPPRKTDENAVVSGKVANLAIILYVSSLSFPCVNIKPGLWGDTRTSKPDTRLILNH